MRHRPHSPGHADPTRPRLVDMIDTRHELVRLAALIDWSWFEEHWAGFFPSPEGRPALHPRLVAGLSPDRCLGTTAFIRFWSARSTLLLRDQDLKRARGRMILLLNW